jgi:hypothetical protein
MENKVCSKCGIEKEVSDFHKWKHGPDGYKRECKECRKLETKKYYIKNEQKIKKRVSDYRKSNPDKIKEIRQKIYERDKERILKVNKLYRENNKEKRNEYTRNKKSNDPIFKLKHLMNSRIRIFMKSRNIQKHNKTFDIVGCTPQELKEHLEFKFKDGMSWDNQGEWHIDHIVPLSSGKTVDEIIKLCHYTNLQPLWAIDNMKKGSKTPFSIKSSLR